MFPRQLMSVLKTRLGGRDPLPTFIWGAPGVGKSQIVNQIAKDLGYEVRTLIASTCDPVDLRGCLAIEGEYCAWRPPKFFKIGPNDKVLFFFDELNTATPAVQTAFFRIILEGKLDNVDISQCPRIGAGNRATDLAAAQRMPTPLVSRFVHIKLEPNDRDWKAWALTNNIRTEVISYISVRPDMLHQMPKDRDTPFPTPRTWEYLSRMMTIHGEMSSELVSGVIGEGATAEFLGFLKVFNELPSSPSEILEKGIKFDKDPSKQHALNGILANHFKNEQNKETAKQIMHYASKLQEEFAVSLMSDCVILNRKIFSMLPEFKSWSVKNIDIMI